MPDFLLWLKILYWLFRFHLDLWILVLNPLTMFGWRINQMIWNQRKSPLEFQEQNEGILNNSKISVIWQIHTSLFSLSLSFLFSLSLSLSLHTIVLIEIHVIKIFLKKRNASKWRIWNPCIQTWALMLLFSFNLLDLRLLVPY